MLEVCRVQKPTRDPAYASWSPQQHDILHITHPMLWQPNQACKAELPQLGRVAHRVVRQQVADTEDTSSPQPHKTGDTNSPFGVHLRWAKLTDNAAKRTAECASPAAQPSRNHQSSTKV